MFEVMVERTFCAANWVEGYEYEGKPDPLHGHNFVVRVYAKKEKLDKANLAIDFGALKAHLDEILEKLDHTCLNDYPDFQGVSTSVENTAHYLYQEIKPNLPELTKVVVYETPTQSSSYSE